MASPSAPIQGIQSAFKRVAQSNDFDDAFACIAILASKSLDEVRQAAIDKFKFPRHPPWWITESMIHRLLAHFGFTGTVYKPVGKITNIPDVAILLVEWSAELEIGRHVVFVRDTRNLPKPESYVIDPAYWIDPRLHVRTDIKNLAPAWYIGVVPMNRLPG
jgi:hypothetical protein